VCKHPSLTQENPFWAQQNVKAKCQSLPWLVKGAATTCTCTKECNKYDLTAADWSIIMIGSGRSLLVVPHQFAAVPVFSFVGGVAKK